MRKFLTRWFIYLFLILLICLLGEFVVRHIPNSYSYKDNYIKEKGKSLNLLVIGASQGYYGIRPEYLTERGFNMANSAQELAYDDFITHKYAEMCPNLKYMIITLGYPVFLRKLEDVNYQQDRVTYYKIYMDCPFHSTFSKYGMEIFNPKAFFRKIKMILGDKGEYKKLICDSLGNNKANIFHINMEKAINNADNSISNYTIHDQRNYIENVRHLENIAQFCKNHNIKLYMISCPVWNSFYKKMDKNQYSQLIYTANKIAQNYNLQYYNFSNDKRFVISDFYDCAHLSTKGAVKFSKILKKELKID